MTNKFNIENEIIHFGLDHLEIYGTFKYENDFSFNTLDFDNSNYGELEDYSFTKNEVPRFKYKIIFTKDNYSLFAYYKGDATQNIPTKDYIVVYSTAFKILTYNEILYFLEGYFNLKHTRRFDICIDLSRNINEILKYFTTLHTGREYIKSGEVETRYIGEVHNTLNKRSLIRIYDKHKDLIAKKKIKLYEDYFTFSDVTRIEVEVRQELAKNRNYRELFDDSLLIGIFKNYLYKHSKIFDVIDGDKVSLYKKKEVFKTEDYQSLYYKTQKKNIFLGHAKSIYNLGFCPVRVLIAEGYIQHKTKLILGIDKLDDLIQREKKLVNDAYYNKAIRENYDEVLANLYKYGK